MKGVLGVESYLAEQGMVLKSAASDDAKWQVAVRERKAITEYLANHCAAPGPFVGLLNRLVHGVDGAPGALVPNGDALLAPEQRLARRPQGPAREALTRIADGGLIQWDDTKNIVVIGMSAWVRMERGIKGERNVLRLLRARDRPARSPWWRRQTAGRSPRGVGARA